MLTDTPPAIVAVATKASPPDPTAPLSPRRGLLIFCSLAFAALAGEMILCHLALTTALSWKLAPIAYSLWMAAMLAIVALTRPLSYRARTWMMGLCLLGVLLGSVGAWFHLRGAILAGLIAIRALPASGLAMPLSLAYVSILSSLALAARSSRPIRLLIALGLAGLAAAAGIDHAAGCFQAPVLTLGAAVILPTLTTALVALWSLRPAPVLRRLVLAASVLLILTGLLGAGMHYAWPTNASDAPSLWLLPQSRPLAAPLVNTALGLLLALTVHRPSHGPPAATDSMETGLTGGNVL